MVMIFLEELGLEKEAIDKIMNEHGNTVNATKKNLDSVTTERDNYKTQLEDRNAELSKLQSTLSSKEEELNSIDDLKKEVETYKLKDLKTSIAVQAGIPLDLAERLSGSTEEEIKADAESLAGLVNTKQPLPLKHTEPPKADAEESAYANMLEKL